MHACTINTSLRSVQDTYVRAEPERDDSLPSTHTHSRYHRQHVGGSRRSNRQVCHMRRRIGHRSRQWRIVDRCLEAGVWAHVPLHMRRAVVQVQPCMLPTVPRDARRVGMAHQDAGATSEAHASSCTVVAVSDGTSEAQAIRPYEAQAHRARQRAARVQAATWRSPETAAEARQLGQQGPVSNQETRATTRMVGNWRGATPASVARTGPTDRRLSESSLFCF